MDGHRPVMEYRTPPIGRLTVNYQGHDWKTGSDLGLLLLVSCRQLPGFFTLCVSNLCP